MSLALAFSLLLGAGLLGLALRAEERRREAPSLPPAPSSVPETTVLLPVRDERHNVVECVETLLSQTAAPRVRVIDDGSTDGTAGLVEALLPSQPRLELRPAAPLPPGWRGKVHALWSGSRDVSSPWLLLTDADARHAPELLARAHAAAAERNLDAVSIAGFQETRGWAENLLIPPVFALLDTMLGDWEDAADGAAGAPVANGQFILVRRAPFEASGGFEAVRNETLDDVAAAARLREHGYRTAFIRDSGLSVRMYRGAAEAVQGWRRNLGGLFGTSPATVAGTLAVLLLPPLALLGLAAGGLWVEAAVLWTAGAASSMILRSGGGHAPAWGLLYPLDALTLAAVLALGVADRRRGRLTSWKGREIKV